MSQSPSINENKAWPMVRLGDVCIVQRGVRVTRKDLNESGKYNVFQNSLKPLGRFDSFNCDANNPFVIMALAAGDVGFSEEPFWAADDCTYFKELKNLDSKYLYFSLLQNRHELRRNVKQATIPRLANKFLENLVIPFPPLSVQREIVMRMEKELSEAGRLATNFKRIAQRADDAFKAELDETFHSLETPSFSSSGTSVPPVRKLRLGEVFKLIDYRGKTPTKTTSGVPLITAKNVRWGYLDYSERFFISAAEFETRKSRGVAQQGDLLFTTEAPLGCIAIADQEVYSTGQRIIVFQWPHKEAPWNNRYFLYYFMSSYWQEQLKENATGATALGIKASRLVNLVVLLPFHDGNGIAYQRNIVVKLDAAKARRDKLKATAEKGLQGAEKLRAAILAEAFEG